jgi:hypothetical protein
MPGWPGGNQRYRTARRVPRVLPVGDGATASAAMPGSLARPNGCSVRGRIAEVAGQDSSDDELRIP